MTAITTRLRWAALPLVVMTLAACGAEGEAEPMSAAAAQPSQQTLKASLDRASGFNTLKQVAAESGLGDVLDGKGPYTVFAPTDAAFVAAGEPLTGSGKTAQGAALLRAHIVPGFLTRADIRKALDADADGKVEMQTMSDGTLTFARDGETITVTAPDGAVARLTAEETLAANGALQPVDAVLAKAG